MKLKLLLLVIVSNFNVFGNSLSKVLNDEIDMKWRLPGDTYPTHYLIEFETKVHDKGNRNYFGSVTIKVQVKIPTMKIVLNTKNLLINEVRVFSGDKAIENITYDEDFSLEFLNIRSTQELLTDIDYTVVIKFTGELSTNGFGFFRTQYATDTDTKIYLASTQLKPSWSRYCFPGYDEPQYKAIFEVKITHDKSYHAISSMKMVNQLNLSDNRVTSIFVESPIMSSYTLAFLISNFDYISNEKDILGTDELVQRFYGRPGSVEKLQFALDNSIWILKALEEYFDVKFPLDKMDNAAIPGFFSGAMENFGLTTYDEKTAMIDDITTPYYDKVSLAVVIAHELTHEYFGNLVTPQFWDYIWLSEGFSTLYEYYALTLIHPEWKTMELFHIQRFQSVLKIDSLTTAQPMNNIIKHPDGIRASLNIFSYDKTGSVLRMVQNMYGDEFFKKALNSYLIEHQYTNTVPLDLYKAFDKINKNGTLSFEKFMESWASKSGYPIVHISYQTGSLTITQKQYFMDRFYQSSEVAKWFIPLNIATQDNPNFDDTSVHESLFLKGDTNKTISILEIEHFNPDKWFIINKQQTGYYRVNYDDDNWKRIIQQLNTDHTKIHVLNRAQLIDDAFSLAKSKHLSYDIAIKLIVYIRNERDYVPWAAFLTHADDLNRLFDNNVQHNTFKEFVVYLVKDIYHELGFVGRENETILTKYTRSLIIDWACRVGVKDCLEETYAVLANMIDNEIAVPIDLQSAVYCGALQGSNAAGMVDVMQSLYVKIANSKDQNERDRITNGMGCVSTETSLGLLLGEALKPRLVFNDDEITGVFLSVLNGQRNGASHVLKFLHSNYDEFFVEENRIDLTEVLTELATRITNHNDLLSFLSLVSGKFDIDGGLSISLININYSLNNILSQVVNAIINHFNESGNESTTITTIPITDTTNVFIETTPGHAVATAIMSIWIIVTSITFICFMR